MDPPQEPRRITIPQDSELPALKRTAPVAPETKRGRRVALGVVLVLAFLAVAWIVSPLWIGVMLGAVMAFTAQPGYRRLVARFHDRRRALASAIMTGASGLALLVLGSAALYFLGRELIEIATFVQSKLEAGATLTSVLGPGLNRTLDRLHVDRGQLDTRFHELLAQAATKLADATAVVLATTGTAALTLIIALVTEYYVLLEWAALVLKLETALPLDPRHTRALFLEFRDVGRGAFIGTVTTALIQGALAATGYAIAGVGDPVTWGFLTALASLLPVVGTFLVWVPIGGWLVYGGHVAWGIFVLAWGFLVVSAATDYVIRPRLVGKRGHAHPLLTIIALLGGIEVMGLAGLIVAPIVMSLFLAVLRIWEREVAAPTRVDTPVEAH